MEQHQEELATIETIDSGAVYTLAIKTHVGMSIQTFRYFAGWCDKIQVSHLIKPRLQTEQWWLLVVMGEGGLHIHDKILVITCLRKKHVTRNKL